MRPHCHFLLQGKTSQLFPLGPGKLSVLQSKAPQLLSLGPDLSLTPLLAPDHGRGCGQGAE